VNGEDGRAGTKAGAKTGRKACDASLDLKSGLLEQGRHQLRRLEFLHPQLAKIKDIIAEAGDGFGVAIEIVEATGFGGAQIAGFVIHD
jgi:hypothetical protein